MNLGNGFQFVNSEIQHKSAFKVIGGIETQKKTIPKQNQENQYHSIQKISVRLHNQKSQNQFVYDAYTWQIEQIKRLFKLYDQIGPQWKIMSQRMLYRTANNLKNRFYTVLRNLIKILFRKKPVDCPKLPGQIPSKDLSRLYDGKQQYQQFKGVVVLILQDLDYNLESLKMDYVSTKYSSQIIRIYHAIYKQRANYGEQGQGNSEKSQEKSTNFGQKAINSKIFPNQFLNININNSNTILTEQNKLKGQEKIWQKNQPIFIYYYFLNPENYIAQNNI